MLSDNVILEALRIAYKKGYEVPIEEKEYVISDILNSISDKTDNPEVRGTAIVDKNLPYKKIPLKKATQ